MHASRQSRPSDVRERDSRAGSGDAVRRRFAELPANLTDREVARISGLPLSRVRLKIAIGTIQERSEGAAGVIPKALNVEYLLTALRRGATSVRAA